MKRETIGRESAHNVLGRFIERWAVMRAGVHPSQLYAEISRRCKATGGNLGLDAVRTTLTGMKCPKDETLFKLEAALNIPVNTLERLRDKQWPLRRVGIMGPKMTREDAVAKFVWAAVFVNSAELTYIPALLRREENRGWVHYFTDRKNRASVIMTKDAPHRLTCRRIGIFDFTESVGRTGFIRGKVYRIEGKVKPLSGKMLTTNVCLVLTSALPYKEPKKDVVNVEESQAKASVDNAGIAG